MPRHDPDQLSVEREAQRSANRRIAFYGHLAIWGAVCVLLLVAAPFFAALVVALSWGVALVAHGFFGVTAPVLRARWVGDEVGRRLHRSVSDERRAIEGRHARALEQLSASVAHEIRNPITAARSLVQQIAEDPACPENVEYARVAAVELDRVERAVSHLLRYAREEPLSLADVEIEQVVDSALETLKDRIAKLGVRVERELGGSGFLYGDAQALRRVLVNLIANALDAFEESSFPEPCIRISSGTSLAGSELWIRVSDNGPGIEPERLPKIFDPFHTSKAGGTGIGLAITRKLVEAHGGGIEVESSLGSGTKLVLTFPRQGPET